MDFSTNLSAKMMFQLEPGCQRLSGRCRVVAAVNSPMNYTVKTATCRWVCSCGCTIKALLTGLQDD